MVPKGNPIQTAYSSGLQVGDFVFLSAVDALDEEGNPKVNSLRENILFCLRKLQELLSDAGGELDSLVQLRIYTSSDVSITYPELEEILLEVIEEPLPALSLIPAGTIAGGILMDGTAVILSSAAPCGGCSSCGRRG